MEYQLECAHQYSNTGTNAHTFKKRKKKKEKTKIEDEKMIEFHVRDTMNRMIKSIEGKLRHINSTNEIILGNGKDWIASQSPFSPGSSKKTRKTRKKKKSRNGNSCVTCLV